MSHHHHGPGCSHEAHDHDHDHGHDGHDHDGPDRGTEYSLWRYINIDQIRCLNEQVEGSAKKVFRPWEERLDEDKYVESDADEQLLIHIPFTGQVKLKAIALRCRPDETAPSELKVFINNDQLDFDSAESTEPTQSWELVSPDDVVRAMDAQGGVVEYPTRVAKFGAVRSLTMFIPANFGADTSIVNYIGLRGDFTPLNKDPIITMYEAAANPADHAPIVGTDPLSAQKPGL
ncbi:galactose-binding domain-like protein [Catenaria anguillulae PL171]|uniref:Galactose-binding domain-like protein n=1 Tax=Catenaria anguillulae PL171 TaxID=765915 RepID=A0A1Y2HUT7_9FUNG|nr:galactose-binding domain-like protein [Catenaria anguillulae PL171]